MARLVAAKCPTCGAGLTIPPNVEWVTCSYCRTSAFIQRAKTPPPVQQVPTGAPIIHVPEGNGGRWLALLPIVLLVIAGAVYFYSTKVTSSGVSILTSSSVAIQSKPMLFDVNGDGSEDAIFVGLTIGPGGKRQLRALNGVDGETLWTSGDLGKSYEIDFALAGDAVLAAEAGNLRGFDARSGKARFSRTLPERFDTLCEHEGRFYLLLADKKLLALEPSTGSLTEASAQGIVEKARWDQHCTPGWTSDGNEPGRLVRTLSSTSTPTVEGMYVASFLVLGGGEQPGLAVGARNTGSRVPMVAGVRGTGTAWKGDIPLESPLDAKAGGPSSATIAAGRAYVTYERTSVNGFSVVSFALANGQRQWETAVPRVRHPGTTHVVAGERHVFVHANQALHALSAHDGRLLWSVGWGLDH